MCEVFGFDSVNKHQEEALRFVFESKSDVFVNLQLELESLLYFSPSCILVWIQLVRRTLYFDHRTKCQECGGNVFWHFHSGNVTESRST